MTQTPNRRDSIKVRDKMKQVRVNIRSLVNSAGIKHEKRNGNDVIVVPSTTMPGGVVMNDIMYPADEIASSFASLNNTAAPLGHPMKNGAFLGAQDWDAVDDFYVGAINKNVRQEGKFVHLDKVIRIDVANRTDSGKELLAAIEAGKPIHTSTGLFCNLEDAPDGEKYKYIARNIEFDHDAILLNEEGAATPEQGVGMMVNANGDKIEVINSALEDADRELDWAVDHLARALERHERVPMLERMKTAIIETFGHARENPQNNESEDTMADDKQHDELSAKVNTLSDTVADLVKGMPEAIANAVKPLTDNLAEMVANAKAKDEAEKADLMAKIVKANILSEDAAKGLTLNALTELAAKAEPGKAAAMNGAFGGEGKKDEFADMDLNKGIKGEAA